MDASGPAWLKSRGSSSEENDVCRLPSVGSGSLLFLCSLPAKAQVSASLSGRVTDQTGAVVSGATVTARNMDTGRSRSTITDQAGRYELLALPIGRYEVRAVKSGFAEQVRTGILLVVGQDATVDLSCRSAR